jgi:hypothetical protein
MVKYLNLILFAGMIVMNYLANALPLNNKTTGELSDSFPNLFVPAGITFSIWGVIYLLLLIYSILQFTLADKATIDNISWLFAISCLFNAMWIVAWHYGRLPMSLIIMAGLLISLIYINMMICHLPVGIIKAAFGVYLGWICIAVIANVTALLVSNNWNGFGISQEAWTIIMILIGSIITVLALYRFNNPFIGLVVIWAFAGIIIKRSADFRSIVITAAACMAIVGIVTILAFLRKKTGII